MGVRDQWILLKKSTWQLDLPRPNFNTQVAGDASMACAAASGLADGFSTAIGTARCWRKRPEGSLLIN
jgi:hypothetical protein